MVTRERVTELLEYDGEKLIWKVGRRGTARKGATAGRVKVESDRLRYVQVKIDDKSYQAHRLIWLLHYGEWPKKFIDHIDGNGLNNRIDNLRDVSASDNLRNQPKRSNNTSGVTGVYWIKQSKKWLASIRCNGKNVRLGLFNNKNDAVLARKSAEAEYGYHKNHGRL